jgi:hypothetical protein
MNKTGPLREKGRAIIQALAVFELYYRQNLQYIEKY